MPVITLWHASRARIAEAVPFMHLGTREAALARAETFRAPFLLHEVELETRASLRVNDSVAAQHPVDGIVEWLETELGLDFALVDELLMKAREEQGAGVPRSLAGGGMVAAVLRERGIDALSYENEVEDPGSISWIVLDPARARIVSVTPSHDLSDVPGPAPR